MTKDLHSATLTNAGTDTETGAEGLSEDIDAHKSLKALEDMYKRGLIPEAVFLKRKEVLLK